MGHPVSEETKRRIRESNLGLKRSDEFREKMSHIASARHHTGEYKNKMRQSLLGKYTGEASSGWKGGRRKQGEGYWLIYSPEHPLRSKTKYVLEHRLIVEKYLGRFLAESDEVHHINKKKGDNRPENLMAFKTKLAHRQFERGKEVPADQVIFDGRLLKH
jgi:uncharacterized protein (DUF1330 family)